MILVDKEISASLYSHNIDLYLKFLIYLKFCFYTGEKSKQRALTILQISDHYTEDKKFYFLHLNINTYGVYI